MFIPSIAIDSIQLYTVCIVKMLLLFLLSFAALFSTNRRRQLEQSLADSSGHRAIFNPAINSSADTGDSDQ